MNKNIKTMFFMVLLTVALVIGLVLVRQNQNLRKSAYFASTAVQLKPDEISGGVGDIVSFDVWAVTEDDAKMDNLQGYVCYGPELSISTSSAIDSVVANEEAGFTKTEFAKEVEQTDGSKCLNFLVVAGTSEGFDELKSGAFKIATIKLVAKEEGTGSITVLNDKTKAAGYNPDGSDKSIAVTSVSGATYNISGGSSTGDSVWAKYRVSFIGVRPGNKCAVDWLTKLVALSGNTKKEYSSVTLNRTEDVNENGEVVFEGAKQLIGFDEKENVALFFKGPKHLQVKYGVQNQDELYNKAGGELSLTGDKDSTPVYDFSNYPMLAGDIDGSGVVDAVDFALVKTKANEFKQVAEETNLTEDLDGSCQVNNLDVRLLIESLNEKQDQIY